jgi:subtilisin family serine protease
VLALALVAPAQGAGGTSLVKARPSAGAVLRAAGGVELAPQLRLWRVPSDAVGALRRAGVVQYAERERLLARSAVALDEPLAGTEWWRAAIGADGAPAPGPGKPVTIVDSGLDITHEEFASRPNTMLLNEQTVFLEDDDHGTEVASVIAAPVNGLGMAGVYPQAILRSWDASPFGFISTGDAVRGITQAAAGGPGVINLSFGGEEDDTLVHQAVLFAFRRGSLVVASSGNDGLIGSPLSYPASYPHVLTVGATDESGDVANFSSQSNDVDLVAPGRHIGVAEPFADDPSGYIVASGTSFSAPMVSGAAAWVWTRHPELDNTQLFDVMRFSARDLAPAGVDRASGFGMLNIPSALSFPPPARDPLEPNDDIDQVSPQGIFNGGQAPITTRKQPSTSLTARVDRHEDPHDVYRVFVPASGSVTARTSNGAVDLRIFGSAARDVRTKPLAASTKGGLQPDVVKARNKTKKAVYMYVEVRPDAATIRTPYTLRVSASARR